MSRRIGKSKSRVRGELDTISWSMLHRPVGVAMQIVPADQEVTVVCDLGGQQAKVRVYSRTIAVT